MATFTVASTEPGTYAHALVAGAVDIVTIQRDCDRIEVTSDGTAYLYFTVDGSDPTVGGQNCYAIPPTGSYAARDVSVPTGGQTVVKLISAGTPKYDVVQFS